MVAVALICADVGLRGRPLRTHEANAVKRRRALTDAEIARFLTAAHEIDREKAAAATKPLVPQLPMWKTLVATGLRWGELCALTWADLDAAGYLTVRPTTAKSKRGRVVPVSDQLLREIVALRRLQFRCTGHLPGAADRIFLTQRGQPWRRDANPRSLKALRAVLSRAGIDEVDALGRCVDVHALRGTAATKMLRRGVPVAHVSKILGHADVRMTMRHYEDLSGEDLRAAVIGSPLLQMERRAD
ncbi:MAG: site-specific integrase [Planctomycetes bacterium]|nr:site-specific integrase [Planctomycetota bacterium]